MKVKFIITGTATTALQDYPCEIDGNTIFTPPCLERVHFSPGINQCSVSNPNAINENIQSNYSITIFPNPFDEKSDIAINNNELSEIILYDIASRKILEEKFINSVSLNTEQLAKGIYLYEMRNKNGVIKKGKVVKD